MPKFLVTIFPYSMVTATYSPKGGSNERWWHSAARTAGTEE